MHDRTASIVEVLSLRRLRDCKVVTKNFSSVGRVKFILLAPQALSHIQQAFTQHPDAGFVYGSYIRQDRPGQDQRVPATPLSLASMLRARRFSLSSNWTLIGTAPLRKSLWEAVGYSDPTLGAEDLHDLEFCLRAMALPCQFYPITALRK